MIAIVIESAKKGKTEENHIKRIISYFCPQIINKIKFYKMAGKGELLKTNNYKMLIKEIESREIKQNDFSHKNFDILKQKITNLCKG
jgi:hypothetical protein